MCPSSKPFRRTDQVWASARIVWMSFYESSSSKTSTTGGRHGIQPGGGMECSIFESQHLMKYPRYLCALMLSRGPISIAHRLASSAASNDDMASRSHICRDEFVVWKCARTILGIASSPYNHNTRTIGGMNPIEVRSGAIDDPTYKLSIRTGIATWRVVWRISVAAWGSCVHLRILLGAAAASQSFPDEARSL